MKRLLLIFVVIAHCAPVQATTVYLRSGASVMGAWVSPASAAGCQNGTAPLRWYALSTSSGTETGTTFAPASTAPPCFPQTATSGGILLIWISPPVSTAVNIGGTNAFSGSVKCAESSTSTNVGYLVAVYRWSRAKQGVDTLFDSYAVTAECAGSALNVAAHTPTCGSTCNLAAGDRLVVIPYVYRACTATCTSASPTLASWGGNGSRTTTLYYEGANTWFATTATVSFGSDVAAYARGTE